ncbi:hypothetical protein KSS87_017867 [Heliosperma pusillum]|nr:hypothetical protein KSS87_017867 [Heliosperma pusillum]
MTTTTTRRTRGERFTKDWLMGGTAAVVAKSGAAPIERVKLLLQNQAEFVKISKLYTPYLGLSDCFTRVLREEGLFALWRGNQANVLRYFPTQVLNNIAKCMMEFERKVEIQELCQVWWGKTAFNKRLFFYSLIDKAFNFAFRGYFKSIFGYSKERHGYLKWFAGNVASGSAAGATTSLFLYHLDYARTRLATDSFGCSGKGHRQFKGLLDVYRKTLSTDGVAGLYRGFSVSIVGITIYRGMYFGLYDTVKPIVLVGSLEGNFFASFFLGWGVTTFSGVCAYPFDTLRRRMMLTSGQPIKYQNAIHAFREIVHNEGFSALFRGVTANILLGVAGAGVLAGYDQLQRIAYGHIYRLPSKKS